ncbi:hypothetical protein GJ699_32030 [Duganella sp. FT80W]|uniref:Uncharacterized protein n=1 Tax=Duganella guangzhouensis TaxID=2666084 RepID=A0A6I2LBU1_9BURK|nr:hypothetical protein [Duganella guangzhouensis]MRW94607.1 hypothetical protein [Duganella guangzhouensis]
MKMDTLELRPAVQVPVWKSWQVTLALVLGLVTAAALAALAVGDWRRSTDQVIVPGPLGGLYSVQLVNGQVYYGVLLEARPAYLRLGEVYYIQSYQQPNGQPGNRVVSRRKNDWHGPDTQTIPADKILTLDAVGPQSQLARLIQQDQAGAGAAAAGNPLAGQR